MGRGPLRRMRASRRNSLFHNAVHFEQLEDRQLLAAVLPGYVESVFTSGLPSAPASLSVDQSTGDVYFADDNNSEGVLRRVAPDASRTLTTITNDFTPPIAGTGPFYFAPATDIQYHDGAIYTVVANGVTTSGTGLLVAIAKATGQVSVIHSSEGIGQQAGLEALATQNAIYFTDGFGPANSLNQYDLSTGTNTVVATNLPANAVSLQRNPADGKLYFARGGEGFFRIDERPGATAFVTQISNTPNGHGNFAIDPLGQHIYIRHNGSINRLSLATGVVDTFANGLETSGSRDVAFGPSSGGNGISLYTGNGNTILEYTGFATTAPPPQPGEIRGTKFNDLDGNGVRGPNEPALANAVIYIDANRNSALDSGETQTSTDSNGNYAFAGLMPGQYVIREVIAEQYRQTSPGPGRDYFFGWDWQRGVLVKIAADTGDVTTLFSTNGKALHGLAYTNAGELYGINGHDDGLYKVNLQTGSLTFVGYAGMNLAFGLAYDAEADVIYGLAAPNANQSEVLLVRFNPSNGSITPVGSTLTAGLTSTSGIAFDSLNRRLLAFDNYDDEIYEFDIDTGAGRSLSIARPSLATYGLTADNAGNPVFVLSENYLARMNPATGQYSPYLPLSTRAPVDGLELVDLEDYGHRVNLISGQTLRGIDFGDQSILATVSGTKWEDANGNGLRDIGEPALANVVVYLDANNNGALDSDEAQTSTGDDGQYLFSGLLPGQYIVREVLPADYRQTSPGPQRDFYWAFDSATDRMLKIDATTAAVTPMGANGSIGVGFDMHGLALTRDGELYAMSGGDNSLYKINTATGAATKVRSTGAILAWGMAYDAVTDTIFGLATPPGFATGSVQPIIYNRHTGGVTFIGNQVTTGVPYTSALAFDPVSRRLFAFDSDDKELVSFDVTTGMGTSLTTNLPFYTRGMADDGAGNLILFTGVGLVRLNPTTMQYASLSGPFGNVQVESLEFANDEQDAHRIYVGAAEHRTGIDFGNQSVLGDIRGSKWHDLDGDGQRDAGEPAMASAVVYLDANNNAQLDPGELTTTTDVTGNYAFLNLRPGKHIVREVQTFGYEQTSPGMQRDFYWGYDSQSRRVVKVDAASGQITPIGQQGSIGTAPTIHGLVQTIDGKLFGISGHSDAFYSIDTVTGLATLVGHTSVNLAWAVTYDPVTDTIYGAAVPRDSRQTSALQLVTIDRHTGAVTYIGDTATPNITGTSGMSFDPVSGKVMLYDRNLGGRLFSFDPSTGASTLLREQVAVNAFGLANDDDGRLVFTTPGQLVRFDPTTGATFGLATYSQSVFLEALEEVDFAPQAHTVYLQPAQSKDGVNFGGRSVLTSISGLKYHDDNADGIRQLSEGPLAGVTVYLDLNHDGRPSAAEPATQTDSEGKYTFADILPGRYIVREVVPPGYAQSPIVSQSDYYVAYDVGAREIVRIDPVNGQVTTIAQLGNYPVLNGLVRTNANELIGLNGQTNTLFKIDAATGAINVIGSAGQRVAWGLGYDATTDKIYGLAHPGGNLNLIALAEYDRATGEAVIIGEPISGVQYTSGITFDPVRRKILAFDNSTDRELYAFDPETGAGERLSVVVPSIGGFGLTTDGAGNLVLATGPGTLVRLNPETGQWVPFLQASRSIGIEGLEFVDFAAGGHDIVALPRSANDGYNFGNSFAVTDLQFALSAPLQEAAPITLSGSFFDASATEPHTVIIDWGNGNTETLQLGPGVLQFSAVSTYADNRQVTVGVTVIDAANNRAQMEKAISIVNAPPSGKVTGPSASVRGQSQSFTFSATDRSAVDQAGTFVYTIDWGDGSQQTVTGPASVTVAHVFTSSSNFKISTTVKDKDGGSSPVSSHTVAVSAAMMQGNTLVVGGTETADTIVIKPTATTGSFSVTINGTTQGVFGPASQLIVLGQAGDDRILLEALKTKASNLPVAVPAFLDGGSGNDTLDARGSTGRNALLGGAGTDTIFAGNGRDLLIGGLGRDVLRGQNGDDILIGGTTDFDTNLDALNAILAEWGRTDISYDLRINHLTGTTSGGLNGTRYLSAATIRDDAAVDELYGDGNQDWFFYRASGATADQIKDKRSNERTTTI